MPQRLTENGLQRSAETASKAEKPATVKRHSESAPPAITASASPICNSRAALISALALDEHAVDKVHAGPAAPLLARTNCAGAPISCWA